MPATWRRLRVARSQPSETAVEETNKWCASSLRPAAARCAQSSAWTRASRSENGMVGTVARIRSTPRSEDAGHVTREPRIGSRTLTEETQDIGPRRACRRHPPALGVTAATGRPCRSARKSALRCSTASRMSEKLRDARVAVSQFAIRLAYSDSLIRPFSMPRTGRESARPRTLAAFDRYRVPAKQGAAGRSAAKLRTTTCPWRGR